jgi:hypothetical protein
VGCHTTSNLYVHVHVHVHVVLYWICIALTRIAIIVLLVVAGVAVTIYTAPTPVVDKPVVKPRTPTTRDMAVGMDDELLPDDGDEVFPEERIEKLLSDRVAEKVRSPRKGKEKKEELFVDKI